MGMPVGVTLEQLETECERMLRFAQNLVAKREGFRPMGQFWKPEHGWTVLDLTALFMRPEDPQREQQQRAARWQAIRTMIKLTGFEAVILGSEAYAMHINPEELRKRGIDPLRPGYSTKELAEMGLGERLDTILIAGQSRDYIVEMMQPYKPQPDLVEFLPMHKASAKRGEKVKGIDVFSGNIPSLMDP